jgi:hypothetical protein
MNAPHSCCGLCVLLAPGAGCAAASCAWLSRSRRITLRLWIEHHGRQSGSGVRWISVAAQASRNGIIITSLKGCPFCGRKGAFANFILRLYFTTMISSPRPNGGGKNPRSVRDAANPLTFLAFCSDLFQNETGFVRGLDSQALFYLK